MKFKPEKKVTVVQTIYSCEDPDYKVVSAHSMVNEKEPTKEDYTLFYQLKPIFTAMELKDCEEKADWYKHREDL